MADLLVDGITKIPASAERRGHVGEYGRRSSDKKYKDANPFSDLNVNKIILKSALTVIGSQCREINTGVIGDIVRILAAAFCAS